MNIPPHPGKTHETAVLAKPEAVPSTHCNESYDVVRPAIHIVLLNYDLFPKEPEFYATYHLANDVTHKIYTGKFTLSVPSLNEKSNRGCRIYN